jgi:multisubunit Na+/H+ antiporter MnhC subunit
VEQRAHRMRPVFGAAAGLVVAMMVLGAFSMWTLIPFGWIWIGSKVSQTQQPSGGPYAIVFAGIVISICTMAWFLSRLNRVYVRLTGSTRLPRNYLPAWRKSLSDERASPHGMSVLEAVILTSVLLAVAAMAIWFFIAAGSPLPSE